MHHRTTDCMGLGSPSRSAIARWIPLIQRRAWSRSPILESGHNRWSKIKHDKAKEDAVKSKERTFLSQEVMLASKYGGPDPAFNPRLAQAIVNAKRGQLSKTSVESAIAKGQGKSVSGAPLENLTVEAMLPYGVAAILEYSTDSKARVLQDIRLLIKNCGGTVTPTAFLFDKKGRAWFEAKDGLGVDEAMDEAIEAGAEDIAMEEDRLVVETQPSEVTAVAQRMEEILSVKTHKTEILFTPKEETLVALNGEQGAELQKVLEQIEEEQSLQGLYINASS